MCQNGYNMAILLNNMGYGNAPWHQMLSELLPDDRIVLPDDDFSPTDIEFALVWDHPHGDLVRYPNLQAIMLLGAGTEHIDQEVSLPMVPIVRLVDPAVVMDMARYALYWVLHFQRQFDVYSQQERAAHWERHDATMPKHFPVTVLGLGQIGGKVAQHIALSGFCVKGWDAEPKQIEGVCSLAGAERLEEALAHAEIVVNCLPLNPSTHHLLDDNTLGFLPNGARVVSISRGAVIDETALVDALDSDRLSAAVLDAHQTEPLPSSSPLWQHPKVTVTPHISGATLASSAAKVVVENINRTRKGELPQPLHLPPCHKNHVATKTLSGRESVIPLDNRDG
ncbi:Glyoxylate/hydroxypyruvate reductase A [Grimontia celer]|uniref:Glyoxylate/hydroxypyruvate reductase A n=1 Tax=Grimontia celer TaxID=1796497 RepID=A0A128F828_9GAMM|nr:glyoxylate/hydroxypyruvate reductase A [Grimontia celer]CZF82957.1 Glyoxylate/hydroxypyruvate reductase A [Grimontia celer]